MTIDRDENGLACLTMFRSNIGGEGATVTLSEDEKCVSVGYWCTQITQMYSLRAKLILIWQIILHGVPWEDFIQLEPGNARAMGAYLIDVANEIDGVK